MPNLAAPEAVSAVVRTNPVEAGGVAPAGLLNALYPSLDIELAENSCTDWGSLADLCVTAASAPALRG